jgi:phage replication-related protein YjqB (UPF0714/DUF867 family)
MVRDIISGTHDLVTILSEHVKYYLIVGALRSPKRNKGHDSTRFDRGPSVGSPVMSGLQYSI